VANNVGSVKRGLRRMGYDIYEEVKKHVPIDLVGMGSKEIGGLGEIDHKQLPYLASKYRFFFNPIRYTSLGLSICEAMMVGLPILGVATTELVTVVTNGATGYVDTNIAALILQMQDLIKNPSKARKMSAKAKAYATKRFGIKRFARDWEQVFEEVSKKDSQKTYVTNQQQIINSQLSTV
jgi:glycosyltransferase involved in cell wall biosynthesis